MVMFVVVIREHRLSIRVDSTKIRIQQRIIFVHVVIIIVTTIVVAIVIVFVWRRRRRRRRTTVHNNGRFVNKLCVRHFRSSVGIVVVNLGSDGNVVLGFCVT
jgi:heme/copper-type cytochrome/quinol oxidase subunit 2